MADETLGQGDHADTVNSAEAFVDPDTGELISDAQVAKIDCPATRPPAGEPKRASGYACSASPPL